MLGLISLQAKRLTSDHEYLASSGAKRGLERLSTGKRQLIIAKPSTGHLLIGRSRAALLDWLSAMTTNAFHSHEDTAVGRVSRWPASGSRSTLP